MNNIDFYKNEAGSYDSASTFLFTYLCESDSFDHNGSERTVVGRVCSCGSDGVHNVHTGYNVSECGIVAVAVLVITVADEELGRSRIVVIAAASHGNYASGVLQIIFKAVAGELTE